jgi:hypothetical protein
VEVTGVINWHDSEILSNSGSPAVAVAVRTAPQRELQNLLVMAVVVHERAININREILTSVWMGSLDVSELPYVPGP